MYTSECLPGRGAADRGSGHWYCGYLREATERAEIGRAGERDGDASSAGGEGRGRARRSRRPYGQGRLALAGTGRAEDAGVFAGPHSYVSPSLYTDPLSVPTWNYIAVHVYGPLMLLEDEGEKETLLAALIAAHEVAFWEKWRAMPESYRRNLLAGIMGFGIPSCVLRANSRWARIACPGSAKTRTRRKPTAQRTSGNWRGGWSGLWI